MTTKAIVLLGACPRCEGALTENVFRELYCVCCGWQDYGQEAMSQRRSA